MTAPEIIVDQLRKKWKAKGWNVTANLEEIPESTGAPCFLWKFSEYVGKRR